MPDLPELDAAEQRVLGSLLEKQVTVPATYPLTLNALRTACNQASSRDPVVEYSGDEISATLVGLKDRGLVRVVWADRGPRTLKYHQRLTDQLELDDAERALLTVLLLRGEQAPGELRSRTERLHPFASRDEVERRLETMADRGLVVQLERTRGRQDRRWRHQLGEAAPPAAPAYDEGATEVVLVDGRETRDARVRAAYDVVAGDYVDHLVDELDAKPFDRWLLDRLAAETDGGPVLDVGCGPGHVTDYLARQGADARGLDLSPAMVRVARERYPRLRFAVGDLNSVLRPDDAAGWSAVVALYALVHEATSELAASIAALARVLAPGGRLLVALHTGNEVRRTTDWWGHEVALDFTFHDPDAVIAAATASGLVDVEWYHRGPYADEAQTRRLYVTGVRPG